MFNIAVCFVPVGQYSSGIRKSQVSLIKSPLYLHKWSFEEERAIVEFVGLARMDPKYSIV